MIFHRCCVFRSQIGPESSSGRQRDSSRRSFSEHSLSGTTKPPVSWCSPALNFLVSECSHPTQEVVCSRRRRRHRRSPVTVGYGGGVGGWRVFPSCLFIVFILFLTLSPSPLPCLFVSPHVFYLRHQKTPPPPPPAPPPCLLLLPLPPQSPRAVRMICKLQTTESPGLVSAAHLGNSISRREGRGGKGRGGGWAPCSPSSSSFSTPPPPTPPTTGLLQQQEPP